MKLPGTRYARSGEVRIAYQVVGNGPIDLVFVPGFISNLDVHWEDPGYAHLLRRLGSFARLIQLDKRGTGLSDRVDTHALPSLETRMDDVRAVMDAAGSGRAALLGASEGGPMAILFAATHPQRVRALILYAVGAGGDKAMHADRIDIAALKRAIETRDARTMAGFYADDALLRIIDCDNPPSRPRELKGKGAIVSYYDDVCSRLIHSMESGIADGERLAFTQACAYPDGTRVFCAAMIELAGGKISKQTVVQAWDA